MAATIDIIMRTKDREVFLARALDCILTQSFEDWRIVLVNSGEPEPVDALFEERSERLNGRFLMLDARGESRLGELLNIGARAADAKYVVVLDDDDSWEFTFLERCVATLEDPFHSDVKGVITRTWVIEEELVDGEFIQNRSYGLDDDLRNLSIFKLAGMNRFSPNSFVYHRDVYEEIGYFDASLPVLEDWDFNLRFLMAHEIQVIEDYLAHYHLRPKINDGDASNTQYHSGDKHRFFETLLINQKLRQEISENRVGLGFVMSHSHSIRDLNDKFRRLQSKLESVSDKVGKVNSRTKTIKDKTLSLLSRGRSKSRSGSGSGLAGIAAISLLSAVFGAGLAGWMLNRDKSETDFLADPDTVVDKPNLLEASGGGGQDDGKSASVQEKYFDRTSDLFESKREPGPNDWLAQHSEPGQTFEQYVQSRPNKLGVDGRDKIYIQPIGDFSGRDDLLKLLKEFSCIYFGGETIIQKPLGETETLGLQSRENPNDGQTQLKTGPILQALQATLPSDAHCRIAVSLTDLYPSDDWNFVLGQASLRARVGVFSFARYSHEDRAQFERRCLRVSAHETGHMFGIRHCIFHECLMGGSNHLAESDSSPVHLCPVCLRKLHHATDFNMISRYEDLQKFYLKHDFDAEGQWMTRRLAESATPKG